MSHIAHSIEDIQYKCLISDMFLIDGDGSVPSMTPFGAISGLQLYGFVDGSKMNQMFASIHLPHDYKQGSDLIPFVQWSPNTSATGSVRWQLDYGICSDNGSFNTNTTVTGSQAASGQYYNQKLVLPNIPGTNRKICDSLLVRISRDSSLDTYTGTAILISFGLHYQADTIGATSMMTK